MGQREAGSCREAQEMINVFQVKENGNVAEMLDVWKHILRSKKYKNHKGVKERGKETELWITNNQSVRLQAEIKPLLSVPSP